MTSQKCKKIKVVNSDGKPFYISRDLANSMPYICERLINARRNHRLGKTQMGIQRDRINHSSDTCIAEMWAQPTISMMAYHTICFMVIRDQPIPPVNEFD